LIDENAATHSRSVAGSGVRVFGLDLVIRLARAGGGVSAMRLSNPTTFVACFAFFEGAVISRAVGFV
jgi:hypothetical protein